MWHITDFPLTVRTCALAFFCTPSYFSEYHGVFNPFMQTYVNNLNAALEKFPEFKDVGLQDLNCKSGTDEIPNEIATVIRNNGGGHWNHGFFWKVMCNPSSTAGPCGTLKQAIEETFGSVDAMKEKFNAAAAGRFGSGWAWLVLSPEGRLEITSTPNQDNPLMTALVDKPGTPILGLDGESQINPWPHLAVNICL